MRAFGKIVLGVVLLIGGTVLWYMLAFPTYTYRCRMTVEVMVDGVLQSGSSVIEVQLITQPRIITDTPPVFPKVRAEAVFVDLGKGRNTIALLASGPNASFVDYPAYVVSTHFKLSTVVSEDLVKFPKLQGRWDLPDDQMPSFVTFTDLNDPKTAHVIEREEFGPVFGRDVKLGRVFIEITSDSGTREIEKKMPWLKSHKGYLGGSFDPTWSRPARNLTGTEFIRGL
jgi:hypothetical protein